MAVEPANAEHQVTPPRRLDLALLDRRPAGRDYVRLVLDAPPDWHSLPGQFVNLLCESNLEALRASEGRALDDSEGGEWPRTTGLELGRKWPVVRRPISISRVLRGGGRIRLDLLVRTVGTGTRFLATRPVGASVDVVGPLGSHFTPPDDDRLCVLVGGGCGIAPLFGLADHLVEQGKRCAVVLGTPGLDALPVRLRREPVGGRLDLGDVIDGFAGPGVPVIFATDDGAAGFHGTATAALEACLGNEWAGQAVALYGCGPEPMLQALARLAAARGTPCQLSLECFMGCGIGVCLSCAKKRRDPAGAKGWTYLLTCRDGPVVDAREILWE